MCICLTERVNLNQQAEYILLRYLSIFAWEYSKMILQTVLANLKQFAAAGSGGDGDIDIIAK